MAKNLYEIYTVGLVVNFNSKKLFVVSQTVNVKTIEVRSLETGKEWRGQRVNYRPYWLQEGESIYLHNYGVYYIHRIIDADNVMAISEASREHESFSLGYIEANFKSFVY